MRGIYIDQVRAYTVYPQLDLENKRKAGSLLREWDPKQEYKYQSCSQLYGFSATAPDRIDPKSIMDNSC